ncbi:MAG: hypothetical protein HC942_22845, partial [Microcoleus sp. SU_5_6]|nr:hypothetical protein [Microcoleus sp. SU_5_6]
MFRKSLTIALVTLWLLSAPLMGNALAQDAAPAAAAPNPIDFRGRQAPLNLYRQMFSHDRPASKISAYRQNNLTSEKVPSCDK